MHAGLVYFWGSVGGFFAAGFVYLLPCVARMLETGDYELARPELAATAFVVGFLAAAAGLVPLIPETVTRGQAISLGLASQTIMKGLISSARDALPSPR
ncbi:MAG TPA: hypothetical protein VNA20_13315 [Frankiaceae bacterium]|nr:hypothetical protein [Frankiaceae bacterium]